MEISISHLEGVSEALDRYGQNEAWFDVNSKELPLLESQPSSQQVLYVNMTRQYDYWLI